MPRKILTCDDEKHIVRLIQVNLERKGYEVITAYNGAECLEKVAADRPDLLVLDVMMPEMTGFEVLEKLKSDPATADIPIIMLTARAQDADVLRGWQSGVECYLTKPFNPMELIAFVQRIFAMEESQPVDKRYTIPDVIPDVVTAPAPLDTVSTPESAPAADAPPFNED